MTDRPHPACLRAVAEAATIIGACCLPVRGDAQVTDPDRRTGRTTSQLESLLREMRRAKVGQRFAYVTRTSREHHYCRSLLRDWCGATDDEIRRIEFLTPERLHRWLVGDTLKSAHFDHHVNDPRLLAERVARSAK